MIRGSSSNRFDNGSRNFGNADIFSALCNHYNKKLEHIKMVNILNLGVQYDKRNLIFLDSIWKGKSTLVKVNLLEQKLALRRA